MLTRLIYRFPQFYANWASILVPEIHGIRRTRLRAHQLFLWIMVGLFSVSLVQASTPTKKVSNVKELIEMALKEGENKKIGASISQSLGLESEISVKRLRIDSSQSPDKCEHTFNVGFSSKEDRPLPTTLIWTIDKSIMGPDGKMIDGKGFRSSLDGKLQNAMKISGIVGELKHEKLRISQQEVKGGFNRELSFWIK